MSSMIVSAARPTLQVEYGFFARQCNPSDLVCREWIRWLSARSIRSLLNFVRFLWPVAIASFGIDWVAIRVVDLPNLFRSPLLRISLAKHAIDGSAFSQTNNRVCYHFHCYSNFQVIINGAWCGMISASGFVALFGVACFCQRQRLAAAHIMLNCVRRSQCIC